MDCDGFDVCTSCYKPLQHFDGKHKFIKFEKEVTEDEENSIRKSEIEKYKLEKKLIEQQKEKKVIHHGIKCNSCGKVDLEGTRYQCLNCDDYDVCSSCYKPSEHSEGKHKFIFYDKEVSEEEEVKIRKDEKEKYEKEQKEKSGVEIKELNVPKDKYKVHLETLKLLGFSNVDLNLFLLEKYTGNVPKVISELKLMS